ncbi:MAG: hypothetical protein HY423_09150 [Candidatus Lambdaproteobacteria bacterium]|nr:hypothetical protein [Candidatus Lambdaproteobacteria bacterium]
MPIRRAVLAAAAAMAWCAAALLGCAPAAEPPGTDAPLAGAWTSDDGVCVQRLVFGASGRFQLGGTFHLDGRTLSRVVEGDYATAPGADGRRLLTARPDPGGLADTPLYCRQWRLRRQTALPHATLQQLAGIDPAALAYSGMSLAGLGKVLVGTDADRHDRLVLYPDGEGNLRAFNPTESPRLYRAFPDDPSLAPGASLAAGAAGWIPVLNLPEGVLDIGFSADTGGAGLSQVLLNVTAASEVTFGDTGSEAPACTFALYENLAFTPPSTPLPYLDGAAKAVLELNPPDPQAGLLEYPVAAGAPGGTAYLWPVGIFAPQPGGCRARIRARPLAATRVRERRESGAYALDPAWALPGTGSWATLDADRSGLALRLVPLAAGGIETGLGALRPALLEFPSAREPGSLDALGLYGNVAAPRSVAVSTTAAGTVLNVLSGGAGAGPFTPETLAPAAEIAALPATLTDVPLSAGERRAYRIALAHGARVSIAVDGAVPIAARLFDGAGFELGAASLRADGSGSLFVRDLAAGSAVLSLQAGPSDGTYTLQIAELSPGGATDPALTQCATASALANQAAPAALACRAAGVRSLAGISTFTALRTLDLSANRIADVTPLADMRLWTLDLGYNRIGDPTPLLTVSELRRLSLAGNPLDPNRLESLAALSDRLSYLDLLGVPDLSEAAAEGLKALMPVTTIVTPAGTVLE